MQKEINKAEMRERLRKKKTNKKNQEEQGVDVSINQEENSGTSTT